MLLVGCAFAIRSERRLCEEVHLNLAYRWFCRLDLEGDVPDHSTFSKNRHGRFRESDLFRQLFDQFVRVCLQAGLVGGEGFTIDASVIEADALRRKAEGKITAWPDAEEVSRPVREYLDALDQAAAAAAKPATNAGENMPPGNAASEPQVTSLTDPRRLDQQGALEDYLIDNKLAIIVDVEATPARWQAEVAATKTMLERAKECFGLHPQRLAPDTAYGSGLMIGWLSWIENGRPGAFLHEPICNSTTRPTASRVRAVKR